MHSIPLDSETTQQAHEASKGLIPVSRKRLRSREYLAAMLSSVIADSFSEALSFLWILTSIAFRKIGTACLETCSIGFKSSHTKGVSCLLIRRTMRGDLEFHLWQGLEATAQPLHEQLLMQLVEK